MLQSACDIRKQCTRTTPPLCLLCGRVVFFIINPTTAGGISERFRCVLALARSTEKAFCHFKTICKIAGVVYAPHTPPPAVLCLLCPTPFAFAVYVCFFRCFLNAKQNGGQTAIALLQHRGVVTGRVGRGEGNGRGKATGSGKRETGRNL